MRTFLLVVAAGLALPACGDDEGDDAVVARCFSTRARVQSYPNLPEEEWPHDIEPDVVDACAGDRYGPSVATQMQMMPAVDPTFAICHRLLDVARVVDAPDPCAEIYACVGTQTDYTTLADCFVDSALEHVHDEGVLLQGCEGALDDEGSSPQCAEHLQSALLTSFVQCF